MIEGEIKRGDTFVSSPNRFGDVTLVTILRMNLLDVFVRIDAGEQKKSEMLKGYMTFEHLRQAYNRRPEPKPNLETETECLKLTAEQLASFRAQCQANDFNKLILKTYQLESLLNHIAAVEHENAQLREAIEPK